MESTTYRWYAPGKAQLAQTIITLASQFTGAIIVHKTDVPAARATLAVERIHTLPKCGPQPGEVWLALD